MTKRFFAPIWKCDEMEAELERLENEGWRLERISGIRKFTFAKASPKAVKYFFTCSFVKERGMIQTEQLLKRKYKATEIHGSFTEGLKKTSIFRITREADLKQREVYRNIYLRHLEWQYLLIALFFVVLSVAGLLCAFFLDETPLVDFDSIFLAVIGIRSIGSLLFHFLGILSLRKQYQSLWNESKRKEK